MAAALYHVDPEDCVREIVLDGLALLYHQRSGMTHIVASPATQILEALRIGPCDIHALLARMSEFYDFEDEDCAAAVAARLDELEAAGLVRRS